MTVCVHELGYLGFEVSDMPRWERFAREVLGVGVSRGPQDTLRLRLDAAPARFILRQGGARPGERGCRRGRCVRPPARQPGAEGHLGHGR